VEIEYNVHSERRRLLTESLEIGSTFIFNDALNDEYFERQFNATAFGAGFKSEVEEELSVVVSDSVIISNEPAQVSDSFDSDDGIDLVDPESASTNRGALITGICLTAGFLFCCFLCSAVQLWIRYENDSVNRWKNLNLSVIRNSFMSMINELTPRSRNSTKSPPGEHDDGGRVSESEDSRPVLESQGVELVAMTGRATNAVVVEEEEDMDGDGGNTLGVNGEEFVRQSTFEKNLESHLDLEEPVMATVIQEMHSESSPRMEDDHIFDDGAYLKPKHVVAVSSESFHEE